MPGLSFRLYGQDISASRALKGLGKTAMFTGKQLGTVGVTSAKLTSGALAAANVGQALTQAAGAAGLVAPAALMGAQAMFTLKLAADGVKQAMAKFQPQLDSLKTAASAGIAPGLNAGMRDLMTNIPVLRKGLRDTGQEFGRLAQYAGHVFSGPGFRADLANIMNTNRVAIQNVGIAGISMARAFVDIGVAAGPAWQGVTKLAQSYAASAQEWIAAKRQSGELQFMIERGVDRVGQFARIIGNLGGTILNVFKAINAGSGDIDIVTRLETMTGWLRRFTAEGGFAATKITNFFNRVRGGAAFATSNIKTAGSAFVEAFKNGDVTSDGWVGAFEKAGVGARNLAGKIQSDLIPNIKMGGSAFVEAFMNKDVTSDSWVGQVEKMGVAARDFADFIRHDLLPTLKDIGVFLVEKVLPPVLDLSNIIHGVFYEALKAAFEVIRNSVLPALEPLARILKDDVVPAVRGLAEWIKDHLIPAAKKLLENALRPLRGAFDSIRSTIDQNRSKLEALGRIIGTVAGFVIDHLAPAIGHILGFAFAQVGRAISAVITVIGALVTGFGFLVTGVSYAVSAVITFFRQMGDMAFKAVEFTLHIMGKLPGPLGAPFRKAEEAVKGAHQTFDREMTNAAGAVRREAKRINDAIQGIDTKKYIQVNISGGQKAINDAWRVWNEINKIPSKKNITIQEFTASYNYSSQRNALFGAPHAAGGPVSPWTTYLVGEQGPELLRMGGRGGTVIPARPTAAALAGGRGAGGTTINIYNAGSVVTVRKLADDIRDAIARGAKPNGGKTGL